MKNRWHRHATHTHAHTFRCWLICPLAIFVLHPPYWQAVLNRSCSSKDPLPTKVRHVCPGVWEGHVCQEGRDQGLIAIRWEDTLHTFAPGNGKILGFSSKRFGAERDRDTFKRFIFRGCLSLPVVGGVKSWLSTTAYLTKILVNWVETTNNHKMQEVRGGV